MPKQKLNADVIRSMSPEEREKLLAQLRSELLKLRSQKERGVVENPGKIRQIRRTIARILTIMNEEELKNRVLTFLQQHKGKAFTIEEIAKKIGEDRIAFLKHIIWRLMLEGKVKKVGVRKVAIAE